MIAGSDGAELRDGLLPIRLHVGFLPGVAVVEQRMLDPLLVAAADAERDHAGHILDEDADLVGDRLVWRIQPYRHVAAADVEADAGDADLLLVGDDAADRLRVAEMAVGADHAGDDVADPHAIAHLGDGRRVVLPEDLERAVLEFRRLRRDGGDLRRRGVGLARHVLGAGRVAERAPCRHRPLPGPLDPGIRIEAGRDRELAGAGFIRIRASHGRPPVCFRLTRNCRSRSGPVQQSVQKPR